MTNDEILALLDKKKTAKVISAPTEVEKPMPKRKGGKGHEGYFKGKKLNREKFLMAMNGIINYGMPIREAYKLSGLSCPTFTKRANQYLTDGFIPAYLVEDGHQIDFQLEPPDQYELIKYRLQRMEKKKR